MSEDVKKITPEELEDVQKIRSGYQELQVQRMQITNQIEILNKTEDELRKGWQENQDKEQKAIQDLEEKYGKVNINLDSGKINES